MSITTEAYGALADGRKVNCFTLKNANGLVARVMTLGATLIELRVPDRDGHLADIVLGKDSFEEYLAGHPCFGSICGRVAGRIGGARFKIEGEEYTLEANENENNLHSGPEGYHLMLWEDTIIEERNVEKLRLTLNEADGHNGFPGNLECAVTYALLDDNSLEIQYEARSDKTTPLNLTNHSYFNLSGSGDVLDHEVQIFADTVATTNEQARLIGRRDPVIAGYNDYREPVRLGSLDKLEGGNADIHFFLNKGRTDEAQLAAKVTEPTSGRVMEVMTTEPGVQFYAGISLSAGTPDVGKGGVIHKPYDGLCLETQDYADSVNFPEMGGAILHAGESFRSTTRFRFSVER
ncbi:MAG: aldose epimerase family protein [Opitutales bacterium]